MKVFGSQEVEYSLHNFSAGSRSVSRLGAVGSERCVCVTRATEGSLVIRKMEGNQLKFYRGIQVPGSHNHSLTSTCSVLPRAGAALCCAMRAATTAQVPKPPDAGPGQQAPPV